MHEVDPEHRTGPFQLVRTIWRSVVKIADLWYSPPADGRAQDLLAGPGVLLLHPPRAHEEAGIVVDQHEELGALGAGLPRLRHERADENVTDPDLVATRGLVAPEGLGRIADRRPAHARTRQMLAQRPLSQADPVGTGDDLGDLGSRPGRHLAPEPHRLGHELGVGASMALVGAWFGLEAGKAVPPVGADPRDEPLVALWRHPRLCRQGAHHKAPLWVGQPVAHRL